MVLWFTWFKKFWSISLFVCQNQIAAFISQVSCLEAEKLQLTEERDTMAETLNRQKEDLTDIGSKLAQAQKRLDESESARDGLTVELSAANERAQVSGNIYRHFRRTNYCILITEILSNLGSRVPSSWFGGSRIRTPCYSCPADTIKLWTETKS